jgi:hypothetical protein
MPQLVGNMLPVTQSYVAHGKILNDMLFNPFSGKAEIKIWCNFENL